MVDLLQYRLSSIYTSVKVRVQQSDCSSSNTHTYTHPLPYKHIVSHSFPHLLHPQPVGGLS